MSVAPAVRVTSGRWSSAVARAKRPLGLWSDHPSVDLVLATTVVLIHLFAVSKVNKADILYSADHSQRISVYGAGAGVVALIAGFTGTAIAQYGSSSGPVVTALRSAHGRAIRRNWISITSWLLTSATICLVAMAVDRNSSPAGSQWIFESALFVALCKFGRLVFLFRTILGAIDSEAALPSSTVPHWTPRAPSGITGDAMRQSANDYSEE